MGKGLHKLFNTFVEDISEDLFSEESGSEFSYFIIEPRNFSEEEKKPDNIKKPWIKATQKEIKNLINNNNSLVEDTDKGVTVTLCMDV